MKKSNIIRDEIIGTWEELVDFRIKQKYYDNLEESYRTKSRIATAEGLCCFLIPAVNSDVLKNHFFDVVLKNPSFLRAFSEDIDFLINEITVKTGANLNANESSEKGFFGDPYLPKQDLKEITKESKVGDFNYEITDSVCFIVSTMIYLKRLFDKDFFLKSKVKSIKKIDFKNIDKIILGGIEKLVDWHHKDKGWGWTKGPGVMTDIYSTWTVAETFADIDDSILRQKFDLDINDKTIKALWKCIEETKDFFTSDNNDQGESILHKIAEPLPYAFGEQQVNTVGEFQILNLYNDIYALISMILFYADREWINHSPWQTIKGSDIKERNLDTEVQSYFDIIIRKILKLYISHELNNDNNTNAEILKKNVFKFDLTGTFLDFTQKTNSKKMFYYEDKGFIPLFIRVVLLLDRYELSNKILSERIINQLYTELILSRHSKTIKYKYLWEENFVSIYYTQKALEAFSDLYLYYLDEEKDNRPDLPSPINDDSINNNELRSVMLEMFERASSLLSNYFDPVPVKPVIIEPEKKIEKPKFNVEFAHVKHAYLNSLDPKDLETELQDEISKMKRVIDHIGKESFCTSVMIDDYNNPDTLVEDDDFKAHIEKLYGVKVDFIIREALLVPFAEPLIGFLKKKKSSTISFKEREDTYYIVLNKGEISIPLYVVEKSKKKYSCELLTACWYLSRLGHENFREAEKSLSVSSLDKMFVSEKIINVLDYEEHRKSDRNARRLVRIMIGEALLKERLLKIGHYNLDPDD